MTAFELEQLYLDAHKKITADVPAGAPTVIDINAMLRLDVRFILGNIIHHTRLMRESNLPSEIRLAFLNELNLLLKDTGFTILFDEKFLD